MFYRGKVHQKIFEGFVDNSAYKYSNKSLAAIYLLSADRILWRNSKVALERKNINPELIGLNGLTPYGYTLAKVAQDIVKGTTHLAFADLADRYLISELTFELIITALKIARSGYDNSGLDKQFM